MEEIIQEFILPMFVAVISNEKFVLWYIMGLGMKLLSNCLYALIEAKTGLHLLCQSSVHLFSTYILKIT